MGTTGIVYPKRHRGRAYLTKIGITPDRVLVVDARYCKTRNEWKKKSSSFYQEVYRHRRHLLSACTAHMVREGDPFGVGYQVYAYEFSDRAVYVGLTCNPKRRHLDHQNKGPVAKKVKTGIAHELKIIGTGSMPTAAGKLEQETIDRYKQEGWTILNLCDGGGTGNVRTKYTYARLLELAQPFHTRKQFNLAHVGAYQHACNHKLIDKLATELGWPEHAGHVWTKEACFGSARQHKFVIDWVRADKDAYLSAWRNGWLKEIKKALFTAYKKPPVRWTREACAARARSFTSRSRWQYGCKDGSYVIARRNGWLKEIAPALFGPRLNRWSSVVK